MQPEDPSAPAPPPPETIVVHTKRVACDGGGVLGHPLVYMEMGDGDFVECGYCDRRFVLAAAAHGAGHESEVVDPAAFEPDTVD